MTIPTIRGDMEDSQLQKLESVVENDDHRLDCVEYCVLACEGRAHVTGIAQGDGSFCERHVHRSVHMTVKRWPVDAGADAASLT